METSRFSNTKEPSVHLEKLNTKGSTCDTFRTKIYGKNVFVKRLKEEHSSNIRYREALRKEFEMGFSLEHPCLARYMMYEENSIYIEYIDGETLSEKLVKDRDFFIERKNSDKLITQLLSAVAYLHSHQILHLDIKPDNILLTRINNDVKLVDLGFCYSDCYTDTTGFTMQYASPEQLRGEDCDERSDIYSIGRIIEQLPNRHIYKNIIKRCTAQDREERYHNIQEIRLPQEKHTGAVITLLILVSALCILLAPYNKTDKTTPTTGLNKNINQAEKYAKIETPNAAVQSNDSPTIPSGENNVPSTNKTPAATSDTGDAQYLQLTPEAIHNIETAYARGDELLRTRDKEFELFKSKLNEYLKDVISFVEDTTNLALYPTYNQYNCQYREYWRTALKEIKKDEWTYSRYKSIINPFSQYETVLRDSIEARFKKNCKRLP